MWLHPKSEMLFESMRKCRIRIPFEILMILDQKISKIEPEMAELAIFLFVQKSDSSNLSLRAGWGRKAQFLISSLCTERKRAPGTNFQPWLHSKSEMLFESMRKCRIPDQILEFGRLQELREMPLSLYEKAWKVKSVLSL